MAHSFAPLPEDTTKDVLDYWFTDEAKQRWFASTAAFDHQVAQRYSTTLSAISGARRRSAALPARQPLAWRAKLNSMIQIINSDAKSYVTTIVAHL